MATGPAGSRCYDGPSPGGYRMEIRVLSALDTDAWLRLRVRALRDHPDAFGRAVEEADTAEEWTRRFDTTENGRDGFLLGAFEGVSWQASAASGPAA